LEPPRVGGVEIAGCRPEAALEADHDLAVRSLFEENEAAREEGLGAPPKPAPGWRG
jgi:hypothetical protein